MMSDNADTSGPEIFEGDGTEWDPASNVVGYSEGKSRVLRRPSDRLITRDVASCIALVAMDRTSNKAGLWHLFNIGNFHVNERDLQSTFDKLNAEFPPQTTELYLIGGKRGLSELLEETLRAQCAKEGYTVKDSILFGPNRIDISVASDEIHVRDAHDHFALMHKPRESCEIEVKSVPSDDRPEVFRTSASSWVHRSAPCI